jgi:uncharacterized membrane protein
VKRKLALAAILLLPMFITQAASPGVDGLLTGLTILFFAFISKIIFEKEKISNYTLAILTLILTFMTMAKPVYIVFGLLALILPTKWRGIRSLIYKSLIVIIPFALYIVWSMLTKDSGVLFMYKV